MIDTDVAIDFPAWTIHDYVATDAPYKFVYAIRKRDGEFAEEQAAAQATIAAKRAGFLSFQKMYGKYVRSVLNVSGDDDGAAFTDFDGQPMTLNCAGYLCSDAGVFSTSSGDGYAQVCTHPIMPAARLVNVDTGDVKIKLAFRRGGAWREMVVDKSTLASAQKIVGISAGGVDVTSETARDMVRYLARIESLNYDALPEFRSASRLGWIGIGAFAPYMDNLVFDGNENFGHLFRCVCQAGSAEKWEKLADDIRKNGTLPARVVLAASVASALIKPLDALPFVVHLWGGTGNGKTVALMLAASVWGAPGVGDLCKSFNATANASELTADFLGSLPLCMDELQIVQGDRSVSEKLIYTLTEGSGKGRATKTGGIQRTTTWRNVIITTGESPITTDLSGGGAVNRVLNINCRDDNIFENARDVAGIVKQNYGWFGKLFIDTLLGAYDQTMEIVKQMQSDIMADLQKTATDKQSLSASVLLAADRMIGLLLGRDTAHNITNDEICQFLSTPDDVDANKKAYEFVRDAIAGAPSKFIPRDMPDGRKEYAGDCWGCLEQDGAVAFVKPESLRAMMKGSGFSPEAFIAWAGRNGVIDRRDGEHLAIKKTIPGLAGQRPRCYAIRLTDAPDGFVDVTDDADVQQEFLKC